MTQQNEKTLDPAEKLKMEYSQTCAAYGHNKAQQLALNDIQSQLEERMKKIRHKASNLPKEKLEETQIKEEIVNENKGENEASKKNEDKIQSS